MHRINCIEHSNSCRSQAQSCDFYIKCIVFYGLYSILHILCLLHFILCIDFVTLYYIRSVLYIVFISNLTLKLVVGRPTDIVTDRAAVLEHDFHRTFSHEELLSQLKPPFIHTRRCGLNSHLGMARRARPQKCTISQPQIETIKNKIGSRYSLGLFWWP